MQKLNIHSIVSILVSGIITSSCSNYNNKKHNTGNSSNTAESEQVILESYAAFGAVDSNLYYLGKGFFYAKCTRCHDLDKRKVGPALLDVTKRHSASWILNLLSNVSQRSKLDSIVAHIIKNNNEIQDNAFTDTLQAPVTTEDERRALLEFLRGSRNG